MKNKACSLCKLIQGDVCTVIVYRDDIFTLTYCNKHKSTPLVVLNEHKSTITVEEKNHIESKCKEMFKKRMLRGYAAGYILQTKPHWYDHLINEGAVL